jgi:RimJ/RimL family protein N-acetyltransferase
VQSFETERLRLRPFTRDDEEIHWQVFSDADVCRYYCGNTRTLEETREWLIHRMWQGRSDDLGFLAVVRKSDETLMGLVALQAYVATWIVWEDEPDARFSKVEVEYSYALGRSYWGNGYVTEAGRALIGYAFKELRLARLVTNIDADNPRSIEVVKRLGFRITRNLNPESPGVVAILDNTCPH